MYLQCLKLWTLLQLSSHEHNYILVSLSKVVSIKRIGILNAQISFPISFRMKKVRVGPLTDAQRLRFLCCGGCGENGEAEHGVEGGGESRLGCFNFKTASLDKISDISKTGSATDFITRGHISPLLDKVADAVCLIQHSPFRILRVNNN